MSHFEAQRYRFLHKKWYLLRKMKEKREIIRKFIIDLHPLIHLTG